MAAKNPTGLAQLARNAKSWRKGVKRTDSEHTERMYGKDSQAKRVTSSAAIPTKRQGK